MNYEDLFRRAEAAGEDGVFTRLDENHPVGLFLGIEKGQRAVMVVCTRPPPDPPTLASIQVETRARPKGECGLVIRLVRPDLKAPFTRLVEDLDSATRLDPADPGKVVIGRLSRWQRLLSRGPGATLDDNELRGLGAELDFLVSEGIPAYGPRAAVDAWVGPLDAPKDFAFDSSEVEVKACHDGQRAVTISSLEQLSDRGRSLHLWCRVVDLGATAAEGPESFAGLVRRLREALSGDGDAAERFEERLRAAGYEDHPDYEKRSIRFGQVRCFRVGPEFPCLKRESTTDAIVSCSYSIATAEMAPFLVLTWREAPGHGG